MTVEVLLSCMHQKDAAIIEQSNLTDTNVLVVNQCDIEKDEMITLDENHRMLNTNSRGLSRSRNLAIENAQADICVLADDDEVFVDNLSELVKQAYTRVADADVVAFELQNHHCKIEKKIHRIKGIEFYRVSSVHISFKRAALEKNGICFDTKVGSGTVYGAGEDNKFMLDCRKKKLKVYYYPVEIGLLKESESQWFCNYDEHFFYRDAAGNRYVMGLPVAILYSINFLFLKRDLYKNNLSFWKAAKSSIRGLMTKDLEKEEAKKDK